MKQQWHGNSNASVMKLQNVVELSCTHVSSVQDDRVQAIRLILIPNQTPPNKVLVQIVHVVMHVTHCVLL